MKNEFTCYLLVYAFYLANTARQDHRRKSETKLS